MRTRYLPLLFSLIVTTASEGGQDFSRQDTFKNALPLAAFSPNGSHFLVSTRKGDGYRVTTYESATNTVASTLTSELQPFDLDWKAFSNSFYVAYQGNSNPFIWSYYLAEIGTYYPEQAQHLGRFFYQDRRPNSLCSTYDGEYVDLNSGERARSGDGYLFCGGPRAALTENYFVSLVGNSDTSSEASSIRVFDKKNYLGRQTLPHTIYENQFYRLKTISALPGDRVALYYWDHSSGKVIARVYDLGNQQLASEMSFDVDPDFWEKLDQLVDLKDGRVLFVKDYNLYTIDPALRLIELFASNTPIERLEYIDSKGLLIATNTWGPLAAYDVKKKTKVFSGDMKELQYCGSVTPLKIRLIPELNEAYVFNDCSLIVQDLSGNLRAKLELDPKKTRGIWVSSTGNHVLAYDDSKSEVNLFRRK